MIPSSSSLRCKLCHYPPFCVTNYGGRIYYVVHKFQSMLIAVIHLGVHNHLVVDGKFWELVEETRRFIAKEVDRTLDAKIFLISLNASKTFFASYLLNDSSHGTMELLKGEQLEHIQDRFYELSSPSVHNLVVSFKCHQEVVILITYFNWNLNVNMITSRSPTSQDKFIDIRCSFSRCQ